MSGPRTGEPTLGPLPLTGVLLAQVGLASALGLLALGAGLPVAGVVLSLALVAGLVRVRGELLGTWAVLALRHRARPREVPGSDPDEGVGLPAVDAAVGPLVVVDTVDHDGRAIALLGGEDGAWSAVLVPETDGLPLLLDPPDGGAGGEDGVGGGPGGLPVGALAGTLSDRGVVVDAVTVVRHVRPGAPTGPARDAHREVLGPLSDAAHRSTWLVVRFDPQRCPEAVTARGGGVLGARRALVGSLARIGRVLADHGVPVRPLDGVGVREAVAVAAGTDLDRTPGGVQERWDAVVLGEVGHATWSAAALPEAFDLDALVAPDAVSTVALALVAEDDPAEVGLDLHVRVTGLGPTDVVTAGRGLVAAARARGVHLDPLHGRQSSGLRATLPVGGAR
ncbi:type VII secretion protein EccE [Actinomycetospora sp. NBRC 106378]|uniref:type VII secretion protein EccE n=1 Tax=Actinomycetospora sp. NBRC 106378 TaxID=3032208 RepID=UPI0024A1FB62|nr:type VII secretion protein EccE [Actinomycetospora sp. NBRC 106378]GLZ50781.1 type VII secretion protein EccE [Actinomycetospora sp. NBRC 106378]